MMDQGLNQLINLLSGQRFAVEQFPQTAGMVNRSVLASVFGLDCDGNHLPLGKGDVRIETGVASAAPPLPEAVQDEKAKSLLEVL